MEGIFVRTRLKVFPPIIARRRTGSVLLKFLSSRKKNLRTLLEPETGRILAKRKAIGGGKQTHTSPKQNSRKRPEERKKAASLPAPIAASAAEPLAPY